VAQREASEQATRDDDTPGLRMLVKTPSQGLPSNRCAKDSELTLSAPLVRKRRRWDRCAAGNAARTRRAFSYRSFPQDGNATHNLFLHFRSTIASYSELGQPH
jgi:hypothetical protein